MLDLSPMYKTSLSEISIQLMFNIWSLKKKKERRKTGFESVFVCIDLLKSKRMFEQNATAQT